MLIRGSGQTLLKYPILFCIIFILAIDTFLYIIVRMLIKLTESYNQSKHKYKRIVTRMKNADNFVEWCRAARDLDEAEGRNKWKQQIELLFYDHILLNEFIQQITSSIENNDNIQLMLTLQNIYSTTNLAGINNSEMYNQTHFGTKIHIENFIQKVMEATIVLRDNQSIQINQRLAFFKRIQKNYGKTALMLSGGASNAFFHLGVLKTLFESKCLPSVFSGASGGSIIAAYVGSFNAMKLNNFVNLYFMILVTSNLTIVKIVADYALFMFYA